MILEELDSWKYAVSEHISFVDQTINDRQILKETIEKHLSQFFDWDIIDYNRDFTMITLKWDHGVNPVIRNDKIHELGMDWIIKSDYDDKANRIVVIEIYPWGIEEDD